MTDVPLQEHPASPAPKPRRPWLAVVLVTMILIAVAGIATWWFALGRENAPDWTRASRLDLAAPAGDAFLAGTPWVRLGLAPLVPGQNNTIEASLEASNGTPVPETGAPALFLTTQPLAGEPVTAEPLMLSPDGTASATLDRAGWWRITAEIAKDEASSPAEFYLLLPDPNINGAGAPPRFESSDDGATLFRRGSEAIARLQTVRYRQWMADGKGNAAVSDHAVRAGGNGQPPGFIYRAAGGMEAVVIGATRWVRFPDSPTWQEQQGAIVVPPAEWVEEYSGATGFTILGEETVDGEVCQLLAFYLPELTEPQTRSAAWYLWWVGTETGHVRREAMVSRQHFMLNHFTDFDAPLDIQPPPPAGTPLAATPVP